MECALASFMPYLKTLACRVDKQIAFFFGGHDKRLRWLISRKY